MPGFGVEYCRVALHKTRDSETQAPTYDKLMSMGPLVTANMTPTVASGDAWGDNTQQAKKTRFVEAAIPVEVTSCPKKTKAAIYGATYDEATDGIKHNAYKDSPPDLGLAYIKNESDNSGDYWEPHFYAKAKAALSPENAQSQNTSISFQNTTINFAAVQPLNRPTNWHEEARFTGYIEAVNWVNERFGITDPTMAIVEITGTPKAGETLGVNIVYSKTPDTPPTLTYKWEISDDDANFTAITGEVSSTYTVANGDVSKFIRVTVTASGSVEGSEISESMEIATA